MPQQIVKSVSHTPGPWHYDADSQTVRVQRFGDNDFMRDYRGCVIAGFEESHGGEHRRDLIEGLREAVDANALLIAAAPEMLEALESLVNNGNAQTPEILPYTLSLAKAAIQKARGVR